MKHRKLNPANALIMLLLAVMGASTTHAGNVMDLVRDTQRVVENNGQITAIWWLPQQFWEQGLNANAAMTPEMRAQVINGLADYTIIAMVRAKSANAGLSDVQPRAELLKNAQVEVNGKVVEPLAPEKVSPVAQLLLLQLKPAMSAMAGVLGGALEFVVYPATADGKLLVNAAEEGMMKVRLYDVNFNWRLPLGALMPVKVDRKSGEEFPGNFQFNPFTGDKLTTR